VSRELKVPDCMASAQPDAELAPSLSSARDQVSGRDRVIGTHTLPEPVDLDLYRIRRQARADGLINEYRLVA
jgi:hypothetical protein